jgi:hypothetical protein
MKSQTLIVASLCMAIGLAVVSAHAQRGGIQAKVPFNFAVSGKTFPAGKYTMIIFHCYNDRCFLSELWSPAQEKGRQLLTSRTEANLAKEERGKYFAVLGEKPRQ